MAQKLGEQDNFRVIVVPAQFMWISLSGKSDEEITCEHIIKDIRRYVDNVAQAYMVCDQEYVCEFCGAVWTEDGASYNGGCCDKDYENATAEERGDA